MTYADLVTTLLDDIAIKVLMQTIGKNTDEFAFMSLAHDKKWCEEYAKKCYMIAQSMVDEKIRTENRVFINEKE
ncbi:MAG: hypothetical protein WC449_06255 [Candidatus Paceibacterota bacterium]